MTKLKTIEEVAEVLPYDEEVEMRHVEEALDFDRQQIRAVLREEIIKMVRTDGLLDSEFPNIYNNALNQALIVIDELLGGKVTK